MAGSSSPTLSPAPFLFQLNLPPCASPSTCYPGIPKSPECSPSHPTSLDSPNLSALRPSLQSILLFSPFPFLPYSPLFVSPSFILSAFLPPPSLLYLPPFILLFSNAPSNLRQHPFTFPSTPPPRPLSLSLTPSPHLL